MSIFGFIIRQGRIFTLIVIVLPIIAGTFAYQSLPKEGEPEIAIPHAIVTTVYPGASPSEIESLVTNPLEEALSDLKEVDEMRSSSAESVSVIVIDFVVDANLELSLQRVREKVTDARKELPEEAEDSTVSEISFSDVPIMLVSVVGDMDPVLLRRLAEDVADELALIPEVLSTDVAGGRTREIHIYLDPKRLNQFGLTILDVYNAVKHSDINIPGGMVNIPERRFLLRTLTEIKTVADFERVPLVRRGDRVVFLGDVGMVRDGHQEDISYSRVDGESSVAIAVKKRDGANILQTSAKVRAAIEDLQQDFPAGIHMVVTADQAKYIQQGFDTMNNSAITGLIIVIIVLYFAMGFRNSLITSLSIPLSLLITFILLKVFGQTNNNMVRFSLVLCIGLLVDNAIIVVENVYHHYQLGKERLAAVIEGVAEIAAPVVSATLTTMAAFLPILLMTGTTGEYMGFLPKTVTIALSASLIVSLVANPLLLSRFMKRSVKDGRIVRPEEDLAFLKKIYVRVVAWSLNHRFSVVCLTLVSMAWAVGLVGLNVIKIEMFPDIDFDYIYIPIETPTGTDVEITDRVARRVESIVADMVPEATQVVATVGYRGQSAYELSFGQGAVSHFAEITVELLDGKEFARASHREIQRRIRGRLDRIPGAAIRFRPLSWGPPTFAPVVVKVIGPELAILRKISTEIKTRLSRIEGAVDVTDDFSNAPPELRIKVDREKSASLGIPLDLLAMTLRGATAGLDIREFQDEMDISKKYDVRVRFSPASRTTARMLEDVKVRSDTGMLVPLSNIAEFSRGPGISKIGHVDRRRVVRVSARNEGRPAVEISKELIRKLSGFELPHGYSLDFSGEHQETEESFASLKLAYLIAFLLIFALLVTQFDSYFQPLAIMTALPLSIVGAMLGLLVTGNNFSIMSFVGLVGLTGIVVNDSIVLVDCINSKRTEGMHIFEAVVSAGQQRLRPILSTTLSTIGGIITLTITDKLWEGLGVVIIFGIGLATVLTLVVVPVMYSLFENLGYYTISAFKGPRFQDVPQGTSFFLSRRRRAKIWLVATVLVQAAAFVAAAYALAPEVLRLWSTTQFQAPNLIKLVIEVVVFFLILGLKAAGVVVVVMLPTWIGFFFLMGRRTTEEHYVDVTPEGLTLTSPVESLFLSAESIERVSYSRVTGRLTIRAGRRRVKLHGVLPARRKPQKVPLKKWLAHRPPSRGELRKGIRDLKTAIEAVVSGV
ncbi:MAG: efflux RND transporter permease subunit [Deltaproteobacteria bacterium]|nr:efflux RND transporter permease subunit [Deltaproteobacteria bacterium]